MGLAIQLLLLRLHDLRGAYHRCLRYRHLMAAGKPKVVVTTAIAREMAGFIWAIARCVTPVPEGAAQARG